MIRGFIASLLLSAVAFTAQQPPKNRTDSATVSAGISKDQLIAEQQLKDIMSKAELALKAGKTHDALKEYRAAVEMVRKNSTLGAQKKLTLFRGGDGIAGAGHPAEAIPIFEELLQIERNCEPPNIDPQSCAGDQQALGLAKLATGDLTGAVCQLRSAKSTYARAGQGRMIELRRAQTDLWIGVALFRLGNSGDAEAAVQGAIPHLVAIQQDNSVTTPARGEAADFLAQAQALLSRIRSAR